jgi:hypothetical protein
LLLHLLRLLHQFVEIHSWKIKLRFLPSPALRVHPGIATGRSAERMKVRDVSATNSH